MPIERHGSGGAFEDAVGYSRVVVAGPHVHVSGCTATDADGVIIGPGDVHAQTAQALANALAALGRAGAGVEHVVRTRIFVTDISRWHDVGRAHAEVFGEHRPAASMLEVSALIDPRMLVEIELDAYLG